jgi:hypothetical protein
MQSKKDSIVEALINQILGFILATLMYHYIVPLVTGIKTSSTESITVVLMFTAVSIARSYLIRRVFNHKLKRKLYGKN